MLLLTLASFFARAEVRLPKVLSDHMVLQRNAPIHLWGWAAPGERVTATLNSASGSATASTLGQWSLYLPAEPAGGPYSLTLAGSNTITLADVLIGDVWVASGQSNMELPLEGFPGQAYLKNAAAEIAGANQPEIRLLQVEHTSSPLPMRDIGVPASPALSASGSSAGSSSGSSSGSAVVSSSAWTRCTPETAKSFSAVAYLFGREIAQRERVPIGLIDSTWGGTPAAAWVSLEALSSDAGLMPVFALRADMMEEQADLPLQLAKEKREDEAARAAGQPPPVHPWRPDPTSWAPGQLFNGMIAPLTPLSIKGVLWYQGESDSPLAWASIYDRVFPALIADWRDQWQQGDFPFLYVQISSFLSDSTASWGTIRDAQRRALSTANTAMAVSLDVGNPENVHPADKQTVAARLALAARANAYGEAVEDAGPLFRQAAIEDATMRVWFDHASGLFARGGTAEGFEVAGDDGRYVAATARIEGATVLVSSAQVPQPRYVRYAWANAPQANLYNAAGLPASTFTSECRAMAEGRARSCAP
ncbi:MAG: sialate O-acetylesterase [Acidobacteriaceae bacterium]